MAANEGWADSGDALTLIHPFPGAAPGTRAMHARLDWTRPRVGSTIHPTSSVTVSLPVKGFARSIAGSERSALRKKESSRNLHSKSLISPAPAHSRARPSAPSLDRRAAALTSPKDQLNRERWRRRRRLFRVSCGRELTGTRALIEKGKRYYTHHGVETAHVRALGMSDRERNQD